MIFIKLFIICLLSITLYSKEMYFDTISLSKIKKVIKKEEQIAKAYKKYVLTKASKPTSILGSESTSLKTYLPNGFNNSNLFGGSMSLDDTKTYIISSIPSNVKSALYDKYYSNENRTYSKAPLSKKNHNVSISFSIKETYILSLASEVTSDEDTAKSTTTSMYYLDDDGVLHWYNRDTLVYSLDKSLIIYEDLSRTDLVGGIAPAFKTIIDNNKILSPGQQIFNMEDEIAQEYINIGGDVGIVKLGGTIRDIGETILKFSRRAGGMIVNGDLYTWGNNVLKGVSIGNNTYRTANGTIGNSKAVISVLVKAKSRLYGKKNVDNNGDGKIDAADIVYNELYNQNYFSSPLRPKFVDFTSDVYHGTCAITAKGELYCAGDYVLNQTFIDFEGYDRDIKKNTEILHRSVFFDGTNTETVVEGKIKITKRAKRVFSLLSSWFVLSDDGYIYYWGQNHTTLGYTGASDSESNEEPTLLATNIKFKDLTYTISVGFRRMVGLSTTGEIYTWGTDSQIGGNNCSTANLCKPKLVKSDITFESILAGQQTVIAKDANGNFYKISQAKDEDAKVENISTLIESHIDYDAAVDGEILSVDISSKAEAGGSIVEYESYGKGIIWVNSKNQLKGDYFTKINKLNTYTTEEETLFKNAINDIDWKIIRMIEDQNGMCGISTENQMYCWGQMVFYQGSNGETQSRIGNTVMLPIFNSNLLDLDKDFLFVEDYPFSIMKTDKDGVEDKYFFMKYPTYIGGFNYEFIFK